MARTRHIPEQQIESLYESGSLHLMQERNDFILPQILDFVERNQWVNLRPEYQRRLVWDRKKKSLFIESLLMNVPVPPIFLYEYELNRYEVMDGQQRLNAILEFYNDELALSGLETWHVLNGRRRSDCPAMIRRGLDRRRISATVLVPELRQTASTPPFDVRREVFERLNTGGLGLNAQELRHALYPGKFNELVLTLSATKEFRAAWNIPTSGRDLAETTLYKRMGDCEIVLRFFAFRDPKRIRGSVRSMLDKMMQDGQAFTEEETGELALEFRQRLRAVREIFGADAFELREPDGKRKLSAPLYDGLMVAVDHLWDSRVRFKANHNEIRAALQHELHRPSIYELMVGRANTADALKKRILAVQKLLNRHNA